MLAAVVLAVIGPGSSIAGEKWTGFYIGAHVGGSALDGSLTDSHSAELGRTNNFQGQVGLYGGYNFQHGRSVWGIEADVSGKAGADDTFVSSLPGYIGPSDQYRTKQRWGASVRGRVGFLTTPHLLVFGSGGLAITELSLTNGVCPATCSSFALEGIDVLGRTRLGWTYGAGLEAAIAPQVHVKIEYQRADFGSLRSQGTQNINVATSRVTEQVVRVGLSFHPK